MKQSLFLLALVLLTCACDETALQDRARSGDDCIKACSGRVKVCGAKIECYAPTDVTSAVAPTTSVAGEK